MHFKGCGTRSRAPCMRNVPDIGHVEQPASPVPPNLPAPGNRETRTETPDGLVRASGIVGTTRRAALSAPVSREMWSRDRRSCGGRVGLNEREEGRERPKPGHGKKQGARKESQSRHSARHDDMRGVFPVPLPVPLSVPGPVPDSWLSTFPLPLHSADRSPHGKLTP